MFKQPRTAHCLARPYLLQLHNNAPTALSPGASGTVRIAYGLEGFDRESVEIFLQGCVVRNDQAPTKPEEQPPPAAIVTLAALVHCQASIAWWQITRTTGPGWMHEAIYCLAKSFRSP